MLKAQQVFTKYNPQISSFLQEGALTADDRLSLSERSFMAAFMLEDLVGPKKDPQFLKW